MNKIARDVLLHQILLRFLSFGGVATFGATGRQQRQVSVVALEVLRRRGAATFAAICQEQSRRQALCEDAITAAKEHGGTDLAFMYTSPKTEDALCRLDGINYRLALLYETGAVRRVGAMLTWLKDTCAASNNLHVLWQFFADSSSSSTSMEADFSLPNAFVDAPYQHEFLSEANNPYWQLFLNNKRATEHLLLPSNAMRSGRVSTRQLRTNLHAGAITGAEARSVVLQRALDLAINQGVPASITSFGIRPIAVAMEAKEEMDCRQLHERADAVSRGGWPVQQFKGTCSQGQWYAPDGRGNSLGQENDAKCYRYRFLQALTRSRHGYKLLDDDAIRQQLVPPLDSIIGVYVGDAATERQSLCQRLRFPTRIWRLVMDADDSVLLLRTKLALLEQAFALHLSPDTVSTDCELSEYDGLVVASAQEEACFARIEQKQ